MKFLSGVVAIAAVGLVVFEATMEPTAHDRIMFLATFAVFAAATAGIGWLLPGVLNRLGSLKHSVLVVAVVAVVIATGVSLASAATQVLTPHDFRVVLISLGLGGALGIALAARVTSSLAADLGRLRRTAERVGAGELDRRSGIERPDEVGDVARALDGMIDQLAAAESARHRAEDARRAFLAAVSHDLRTPLTSMQAAVEALQDGVAPDPDRYLRVLGNEMGTLANMVNDLFLMAKIDADQVEFTAIPLDLVELADDVVEAMRPRAERQNVSLVLEAAGPVEVEGGERELARVIRNLLDNALRHAPPASTVWLSIENGSGSARLVVRDEGPGFSEGFREKAFEQFTKADPARTRTAGGAGLGLAIARGLVRAHAGRVWAGAGPGGAVGFELPARSTGGVSVPAS